MILKEISLYQLQDYISKFFSKYGVDFHKSLSAMILGLIHSGSSSTGEICTSISAISGKTFKAANKQVSYLLSNCKFQIDDMMFRCYMKIIFSFLQEGGYISKDKRIPVQIDFTTIKDDFIILYASIVFRGKAVPLYFSMRKYPKKKDVFNQIKMERAFMVRLRHCLSKEYNYVIVADRGFGNGRIINYCKEFNFSYVLRLDANLKIGEKGEKLLNEIKHSKSLENIYVPAWKDSSNIIIRHSSGKLWYLATDIDVLEREKIVTIYRRRFKIEKCFFDQKSNGFNIEKTRITKYDRVKRLIFCICIAQALMLFVGDILKHNHHTIKKTFPESLALISAFSFLQEELLNTTS